MRHSSESIFPSNLIEYLREFESICKTVLAHESGNPGVQFNEKIRGSKISWDCPFKASCNSLILWKKVTPLATQQCGLGLRGFFTADGEQFLTIGWLKPAVKFANLVALMLNTYVPAYDTVVFIVFCLNFPHRNPLSIRIIHHLTIKKRF
jgi:hypothetical protein